MIKDDNNIDFEDLLENSNSINNYSNNMYGKLTFYTGPMFSGKTTALLKDIIWSKLQEEEILIFKPSIDSRYSEEKIISHDSVSTNATPIKSWPINIPKEIKSIYIDEVQFLYGQSYDGDIINDIKRSLEKGINVTACGLDMDWKGEAFILSGKLMAMADSVKKFHSLCSECGKPATKSFKRTKNDLKIEVGGSSLYEPRCNKHWSYN